uniref:Uncharacterized protein n=1 Tax=viral metagenome TaxID=1070528 RepID=A0A6C0AHX0_9ZZZZ
MEEWYSAVHRLEDESDDGALVKSVCHRIFYSLNRLKIKDKKKFGQRLGPEFESWRESVDEVFSKDLVHEIVGDDDFWKLTFKVARGSAS